MKNLKYLFIFFFLLSCGYTPIYQTDQNSKIRLDMINYSGDKKLGRSITRGIERLKNNKSDNIYDLNLIGSKKESVASKDKKGNISTYKMLIEVDFNLESNSHSSLLRRPVNLLNKNYSVTAFDLFIARDPFGVRPLFIGRSDDGSIGLCSEAKGLVGVTDSVSHFKPGSIWNSKSPDDFTRYHDYDYHTKSKSIDNILFD